MKMFLVVGVLLIAAASSALAQVNEQILGTWRLINFSAEVVPTGENVEAFGNAPQGYLNYGSDGRMLVIMVKENRPKRTDLSQLTDADRVELFKSMVAYGGTFRVEGDRIIHEVDVSWNENWTGTSQVRRFRIDGRKLIIRQDPQVGPDGRRTSAVLTWEKVQ
jgi:hypothetical protein